MSERARRTEEIGCFRKSLDDSVRHFTMGEDAAGLDDFLKSLEALTGILDSDNCPARLSAALEALYSAVRNQDIIGITDLLEFSFIPLINEWDSGCEKL